MRFHTPVIIWIPQITRSTNLQIFYIAIAIASCIFNPVLQRPGF